MTGAALDAQSAAFDWDRPPQAAIAWEALPLAPLDDRSVLKAQVFASMPSVCSYLPAQRERMQIAQSPTGLEPHVYSWLIQEGFRRSGGLMYRPNCIGCTACLSLRVCADAFTPSRSQRRAWAAHAHLSARAVPLHASAEHYALYRTYQNARHAQGDMKDATPEQYRDFMARSAVRSVLVEFRARPRRKSTFDAPELLGHAPSDELGPLRMVSLIDVVEDGLSAVYTFYDPEAASSGLGTFGVLWQIALARRLKLPFVYLGYYIHDVQNMRYKNKFEPYQFFLKNQWFYSSAPIFHRQTHDWDFPNHTW